MILSKRRTIVVVLVFSFLVVVIRVGVELKKERTMLDCVLAEDVVVMPCKAILKACAMSLPELSETFTIMEFDSSVLWLQVPRCYSLPGSWFLFSNVIMVYERYWKQGVKLSQPVAVGGCGSSMGDCRSSTGDCIDMFSHKNCLFRGIRVTCTAALLQEETDIMWRTYFTFEDAD
ncbi:unnamed protein product [Dovyalis caffra]|uniref:Uncharacterized protein n=1 Tax=Dovyalis caffra TaxID=77055 RepID=A0AAV1SRK1_9ROSI|nr:unnamed protein product [Dovyalis caffra]